MTTAANVGGVLNRAEIGATEESEMLTSIIAAALILIVLAMASFATGARVGDASLTLTLALPNAASTAKSTNPPIDTGAKTQDAYAQPDEVEWFLTAPALSTTQLPDTRTVTYDILGSDNPDLSSPTVIYAGVIVQTGAGGIGAAQATFRFRLPGDAKRYIGFRATTGVSTGDCSAASATLQGLV